MWEYLITAGFFASLLRAGKRSAEQEAEEQRRKNTSCHYTDGISQALFEHMAHTVAKNIKRIKYIHIDGLTILCLVKTNSGLSKFGFEVDFNDYGHITGRYWLKSDNDESSIPNRFAETMKYMIINKEELFGEGDEDSNNFVDNIGSKRTSYERSSSYLWGNISKAINKLFGIIWKWLKRIFICATVICVLCITLCVYDYWSTKKTVRIDNRMIIGVSSSSVIGKDYESVEKQLEEAGFSNVVSYEMYDLDYSSRNREGTIGKIKVDDKETFSSIEEFDKDDHIVIEYHSLKYERPPMNSKEAKNLNYNEVVTSFNNSGFGNIKLVQKKDLLTGWLTKDGSVESVSINGDTKYRTTSAFRVDTEITVTYHTFKDK
ncbi:MAG: PASTA domain-containing protein [Butyrivibrio hungatei]|nr:PASTA domain-containing protein [Butyrivibrio hungatei]